MYTIKFSRHVNVPTDIAWYIISDMDGYADYAPNLSMSKIVSGNGQGAIRQCADNHGGEWNEECVLWDEGRLYSIKVNTADYPYPFASMQGTWGVEPDNEGSLVTMQFDFLPKPNPPILGWFMVNLLVKPKFMPIGEELMNNWEQAMLTYQKQQAIGIAV